MSRRTGSRRRAALAVVLAGLAAAAATPEAELTLETLMRHMAETRGVRARFVEVKELALLREPIETQGVLTFVPPDRMARRITAPGASLLVVDGDRMELVDEAGTSRIDLATNPVARAFAENLTVLFRGDLEALRERYHVAFEARAGAGWSLRLVPRHAPVRDFIESITLLGRDRVLREIVLRETDGDRTTTRFRDVEADRVFSAEELEAAFGGMPPAESP